MKITKLLIVTLVISLNTVFAQEKVETEISNLEFPNTSVIPMEDTQNGRQYELYVELPEGYETNKDKKYPVIYYTDAVWHIEVLSASQEYIMEDAILVGISWQKDISEKLMEEVGPYVSRYRDYSVSASSNPEHQAKYQFGNASNHLEFIRNDVFAYIENNYRTETGNRTYFGYSTGGLFGTYILVSKPETFKNYIIGSPSLWRDVPYLSELAMNHENLNANVFISTGTMERELSVLVKEFVNILESKNDETLLLHHSHIEGSHQTAFPGTAINGIHWLARVNLFPEPESPYFGQKTPGLTPEVFAPELVSVEGRYEGGVNFSPDMREMYFSPTIRSHSEIHFSKFVNNQWTYPEKADFTKGKISDEFSPFVSYSSDRIYFCTYDSTAPLKLWYVNRLEEGWSEAKLLDSPINAEQVVYPNMAENGDIYYLNSTKNKTYYAPHQNSQYPKVYKADIDYGMHATISPSQDYLVVTAHKENDETKDKDLHVCFKKKDGTWSSPINLGNTVNTSFREGGSRITPDGKYLFFNRYDEESGNPNVYWVSTEVIDMVRPE